MTAHEMICRVAQLECEAKIKDDYAYLLAKERDEVMTQLSDATEKIFELEARIANALA